MRPVLLDTNAYTAFMLGAAEVFEVVAHAERLYLTSIVLGELLGGFAAGTREPKNRAELARFLDSPRVEVLPVTAQTADSYALVYVGLSRKGQPIPTNDLWIAASALEHGAALLTRDAHFSQIDGLRCGQRLEDFLP
ncbi:MAG: type II toxin-antitoxin system VapC family toxin [Burkholderiales bacterium]|nr:type II toxin-antitoxin system VapC family toxin [Burkholderiales bacterium]